MKLIKDINIIIDELDILVKRINKTNNETIFEGNLTLADAISSRDRIKKKRNILISVLEEASIRQDRYSHSEVKFVSMINVSNLQNETDLLAKQYKEEFRYQNTRKELDNRINIE